jgi:Uma2 family endonuclease
MQLVVNDETVIQLRDMSEEEFYEFCSLNDDYRIERTAQGDILIMPPAGTDTGDYNAELTTQLRLWAKRDGRGRTYDSNAGFTLPNGAIRSPDACWVSNARLAGLTREQKRRFAPVCPEFVVELTSPTDRLSKVQEKMQEWLENGAQLGWILHVDAEEVHIYRPGREVEVRRRPERVAGESPVQGFVLDLTEFWTLD